MKSALSQKQSNKKLPGLAQSPRVEHSFHKNKDLGPSTMKRRRGKELGGRWLEAKKERGWVRGKEKKRKWRKMKKRKSKDERGEKNRKGRARRRSGGVEERGEGR